MRKSGDKLGKVGKSAESGDKLEKVGKSGKKCFFKFWTKWPPAADNVSYRTRPRYLDE